MRRFAARGMKRTLNKIARNKFDEAAADRRLIRAFTFIQRLDRPLSYEGLSVWCWWAAPFWAPFAMPSAAERPPCLRDGMLGEMMRGRRAVRHAPFII